MTTSLIRIQSLSLGFLAVALGIATTFARQDDHIPRDRLMTDKELLAQLKLPQEVALSASEALKKDDVTFARKVLSTYLSSRESPHFFFTKQEIRDRIKEFTHIFPEETKSQRSSTGVFMNTYGADVDWRMPGKDLRGRTHTPNTVRYLARQWEAFNLAVRFFQEKENPAVLRFLNDHVRDFASDFEGGKVESGDNDVFERFYGGHRLRNWIMMHQLLLASPAYSADDQVLMLKLFLVHGAKLADQSKRFNWGNHQLVGLVALYELSVMFPEFTASATWHDQARKLILEHLEKEVAPDGFQAERSSHYHKLDIANYFLVLQLARLNSETLPPTFLERYRKMFQAMADVAMPNRCMPILQDVSDSLDVRSDRIDDEMSLGTLLFNDPTFRYFSKREFPASLYWYFDRKAVTRYRSIKPKAPAFTSLALEKTGYFVMRSGWDAAARYLLIDGGLAADKPDHTHGGVLGLIGYALGRVVLPNYPVRYSDASYRDMKNSLVKNVALVDDLLQGRDWIGNRANTGFGRWGSLPKPTVTSWIAGTDFDFFAASHDGFRVAGVEYGRIVVFLKPSTWLVLDTFKSDSSHRFQQLWQGSFKFDDLKQRAVEEWPNGALVLVPVGEKEIEMTTLNVAYANAVRFLTAGAPVCMMGTLIYAADGPSLPKVRASVARGQLSYDYTIEIGNEVWSVACAWAGADPLGQGLSSVTAIRYRAGRPESILVVNGSKFSSGNLNIALKQPASYQLKKDKKSQWVLTLMSGNSNAVTVDTKGLTMVKRDVTPGKPLVIPSR